MPPQAAITGSSAFLKELNSPTKISSLISNPTTKKKMAIKASFTKANKVIGSP